MHLAESRRDSGVATETEEGSDLREGTLPSGQPLDIFGRLTVNEELIWKPVWLERWTRTRLDNVHEAVPVPVPVGAEDPSLSIRFAS